MTRHSKHHHSPHHNLFFLMGVLTQGQVGAWFRPVPTKPSTAPKKSSQLAIWAREDKADGGMWCGAAQLGPAGWPAVERPRERTSSQPSPSQPQPQVHWVPSMGDTVSDSSKNASDWEAAGPQWAPWKPGDSTQGESQGCRSPEVSVPLARAHPRDCAERPWEADQVRAAPQG